MVDCYDTSDFSLGDHSHGFVLGQLGFDIRDVVLDNEFNPLAFGRDEVWLVRPGGPVEGVTEVNAPAPDGEDSLSRVENIRFDVFLQFFNA